MKIMGYEMEIKESETTAEGVRYDLYAEVGGPCGAVEIIDVDSGMMVGVTKYNTYDEAKVGLSIALIRDMCRQQDRD